MVDMSVLLAAQVANQAAGGTIAVDDLRAAFTTAKRQTFSAQIYEMTKTQINLRLYVTDRKGIVLFDSDGGLDEGKDYSRWNDVYRTLRGKYGARASRTDPDDPLTSLLCVSAPIMVNGEIAGVLAVCKPTESVWLFLELARRDIMVLGVIAMLALLLIAASILLISNTIRLSLFARRREVEVMKLVGATDSFIRWPFLIEGVILGLIGGVAAILLLLEISRRIERDEDRQLGHDAALAMLEHAVAEPVPRHVRADAAAGQRRGGPELSRLLVAQVERLAAGVAHRIVVPRRETELVRVLAPRVRRAGLRDHRAEILAEQVLVISQPALNALEDDALRL